MSRRLLGGLLCLALPLASCCIEVHLYVPQLLRLSECPEQATPRILAVVAHPDDETAFAATLYASGARGLGGICDVVVITNGEGGFKYSTLAQDLYGAELAREEVGREKLPNIRRTEMSAACFQLGVHELEFLAERDHRYTLDEGEVLAEQAGVWDLERVRQKLGERLERGRYEFALCLLPVPEAHAHHKAAAILLLEAVAALPPATRPVVLGVASEGEDERVEPDPAGLPGWSITALDASAGRFVFDRRRRFGYRDALDWRIVVDWAIAAHKSQGTLQMMAGEGAREVCFPFAGGPRDGAARAAALFERLAGVIFEVPEYGSSAGANVVPPAR